MADAVDIAGTVGAGALGTLLARALGDSDLANRILVRIMTRRAPAGGAPDYRVPTYAGADLNLSHGSGEAVMASRISRMLNQHGIGSYYSNTQGRPNDAAIAAGPDNWNPVRRETGRPWHSPMIERNIRFWSNDNRINGSDLKNLEDLHVDLGKGGRSALEEVLSRFTSAGVPRERAMQMLQSGAFDGFTPGELVDALSASGGQGVRDIAAGKAHIAPYSKLGRRFFDRTLPYLLSGEAGMTYTSLPLDTNAYNYAKAISENSYPFAPVSPSTRNLALDTQFQANYRGNGDPLIPGSGMYDPGPLRRSRLARMWRYYAPRWLGGGGRADYRNAIRRVLTENGVEPKDIPRGAKYMLISTGSAGANAAEKVRLASKAFADDPRVRILVQYGKKDAAPASRGLDLYTNNGVLEAIAAANARAGRPNFVVGFDRHPDYGILSRNVDLHGTYGGSSTITEALANTNPTVTMTDTILNRGNNNYGTARRGIPQIDSAGTAVLRQYRATPNEPRRIVNSRDGDQTLSRAMDEFGLRGADLARREDEAVAGLRRAMYGGHGKFDRSAVAAANSMLAEQAARNRSFVDTTRRMVTHAIDKGDAARYAAMRPGFRKAFAAIPRSVFATPAGRRIGIPLAILSALGLGGAMYKWRK